MGDNANKVKGNIIVFTILAIGSIVMIVPFLWMITTSFDKSAIMNVVFPPRFYPKEPSIMPYKIAFTNSPMWRYSINSLFVSAGIIMVSCSSSLLSGYALSKIRFKGANVVLILALSTMMIPFEMTMIPQYLLFSKLKLTDSYLAFFLPAVNYAFGTFIVKQFMDAIPATLRESAKIDGASEFTTFRKIYLPLSGTVITTLVILVFLWSWNDFLWPLIILISQKKYTIQIGVALFTYNQGFSQMPAIRMVMSLISVVPVLVVYLFLQRYIIESIALTGIKQ